ncbi:MAG: hypothetical protein GY756_01180, partial [bacterium]|nr:hypothetical protein [bacterium]
MKKSIKIILSVIVVLIILCIAAYFLVTSSFFLKDYAIPYLANKNGYNIKLKTIELSPFASTLKINDLKIRSKSGIDFSTSKFDASISFFELFGGTLKINKLDLDKTYLTINKQISKADVSSKHSTPKNKTSKPIEKTVKKSTKSKFKLDVNNINIKNFNVQYLNGKSKAALSNFDLTLNHLSPGNEGVLEFNGKLWLTPDNQKTITGNIKSTTKINISEKNILNEIKSYTKLTIGNTVTPVIINLQTLKNNHFDLSLDAKNILFDQIIKTFVEGKYKNTSLKLNSIRVNIQGNYFANSLSDLQAKIKLADADINSKGNFLFKTDSLNSSIDIKNMQDGIITVNKLILNNTSVKLVNGPSTFALNDSNILINNLGSHKDGSVLFNGDIDINSKGNNVKGFISGKTNLYLGKNYFPEKINSNTKLKVGDTTTPISITMTTNKEINNQGPFSLNIKINNIKLQPLTGAVYSGPYSSAKGYIKSLHIDINGKNLNAFERFLRTKNSSIEDSSAYTNIKIKN